MVFPVFLVSPARAGDIRRVFSPCVPPPAKKNSRGEKSLREFEGNKRFFLHAGEGGETAVHGDDRSVHEAGSLVVHQPEKRAQKILGDAESAHGSIPRGVREPSALVRSVRF